MRSWPNRIPSSARKGVFIASSVPRAGRSVTKMLYNSRRPVYHAGKGYGTRRGKDIYRINSSDRKHSEVDP